MTTIQERPTDADAAPIGQQAVHFSFYKIRPSWWQLDIDERRALGAELTGFLKRWDEKLLLVQYSLAGLRADCDLMLWKAAENLDDLHQMGLELSKLGVGPHLEIAHTYLSMTKRSIYIRDHEHEGQEGSRLRILPVGAKYLFVYPFVKTRAWYRESPERRHEMMAEHIRIGHKYKNVRINTTYSYGLDDQEFVLAFESDSPGDFLDLVMELRDTEASSYTLTDTPMFTCIKAPGEELLATFGL